MWMVRLNMLGPCVPSSMNVQRGDRGVEQDLRLELKGSCGMN